MPGFNQDFDELRPTNQTFVDHQSNLIPFARKGDTVISLGGDVRDTNAAATLPDRVSPSIGSGLDPVTNDTLAPLGPLAIFSRSNLVVVVALVAVAAVIIKLRKK